MKRWMAVGVSVVLAGACSAGWAEPGPTDPANVEGWDMTSPGLSGDSWEAEAPAHGEFLMELAQAGLADDDVVMALAQAGDPQGDVLMELAQGPGPGGGEMRAGGPAPMEGPGGPLQMMMRRGMRFRGGPGMGGGPMGWGRGGPMMGMMGPMMLERARKALGLTDDQVAKLHDLGMAARKDMIRLGADARIAQMELQDALRQPTPKVDDVKTRVAAVNAARSQMLEKRVNARLEMQKVFTPEQREKIRNFMLNRGMGGGGQGGGMGGGWGGGWGPRAEPKPEPKK